MAGKRIEMDKKYAGMAGKHVGMDKKHVRMVGNRVRMIGTAVRTIPPQKTPKLRDELFPFE